MIFLMNKEEGYVKKKKLTLLEVVGWCFPQGNSEGSNGVGK